MGETRTGVIYRIIRVGRVGMIHSFIFSSLKISVIEGEINLDKRFTYIRLLTIEWQLN